MLPHLQQRCRHHCAGPAGPVVKKNQWVPMPGNSFDGSQSQQDGRAPLLQGPGSSEKGKNSLLLQSPWQPGVPHQIPEFIHSFMHPCLLSACDVRGSGPFNSP